ncbi:MAG: HNH endonuclease [Candidatus Tectomicrobia bacterium]|uniref:HNH endonuclease n=1 Tax=Tectimicrobiota bacterium TaxID=2528274 RepID=A0A932M0F9_UNCTE|nr:HNH endonuclease [Candidatus Tectomicrobia bacterium]
MNPRYAQVALRAGHRCEYCHAPEAAFNFPFEIEHIVPISGGGDDAAVNWALACRACNLYKASHVNGSDPESHAAVRLFHPREDQWESHFQIVTESGEIAGRTAIGRATVARLGMNSAAQVAARQQWMRIGLFP